jgi:DNA-binding transcriptional MerR regulator
MDEIFASLAPRGEGEAQLVALVADDIRRLSRLAKIEKGVSLARIEELLGLTGSGEKAGTIVTAIQVVGNALNTWSAPPLPSEKCDEPMRRLRTMTRGVDLVGSTVPEVPRDLLDAVEDVAGELMAKLLEHGNKVEAKQDVLRASISGIALPDEAKLKKLARYRSMLELSLQRRLAALEQMRKLTAANVAGEEAQGKAREYRMKLRVVA